MWHKDLDRSSFLKSLYNEIPELIEVRIASLTICDEGEKIRIIFDMPKYVDNVPKKWSMSNYNTVSVMVDFVDIRDLSLKATNILYCGDIKIQRKEDNLLEVNITGTISMSFKAAFAMVQEINGYQNEKV